MTDHVKLKPLVVSHGSALKTLAVSAPSDGARAELIPIEAVALAPKELDLDSYGLPPVLDVTQAAKFLGLNAKTLYEAIGRGELPGKRIGKRRIVILRDVLLNLNQAPFVDGPRPV